MCKLFTKKNKLNLSGLKTFSLIFPFSLINSSFSLEQCFSTCVPLKFFRCSAQILASVNTWQIVRLVTFSSLSCSAELYNQVSVPGTQKRLRTTVQPQFTTFLLIRKVHFRLIATFIYASKIMWPPATFLLPLSFRKQPFCKGLVTSNDLLSCKAKYF